jgi:flagellar hook assembly protein FlgD
VDDTPVLAEGILRGAYPNPFNPQTTINYALPQDAAVTLVVHDVSGRVVRTLRSAVMESAGNHDVVWNGRDDAGRQVGSGVYLVRLAAAGVSQIQRVALIK